MILFIKVNLFCALILLCLMLVFEPLRTAFTIGTGVGLRDLQKQIENIQSRAINGQITEDDKKFLAKFYRIMAYGAQLTFVLPESARLMHHYLDGSGVETSIDKSLYTESKRVVDRMSKIRKYLSTNCEVGRTRISKRFDMGHGYPLDAHFSLYFGTISGRIIEEDSAKFIQWDVIMPWKWPTYDDIKKTYGTYYKEIIPFPNALSLMGFGKPMWLPNGLGGELEKQGLAKAFDVNTTWRENFAC